MTGPVRLRFSRPLFVKNDLRSGPGRSIAAFTLIELMVVIVIIGLLSALAVPRFLRANAEARLEGEAQRMLLDFRLAKQAANKTGFRHFIVVKPPRNIEVWRTKTQDDSTYDQSTDSLVFQDSLDGQVQFGFATTNYPSIAPLGFAAYGAPSQTVDGLGKENGSAIDDCVDGKRYPATTVKNRGWGYPNAAPHVIPLCGSSIADMANGIAYFTTTGSDNRIYALSFSVRDIQLRLWRWIRDLNTWEEV